MGEKNKGKKETFTLSSISGKEREKNIIRKLNKKLKPRKEGKSGNIVVNYCFLEVMAGVRRVRVKNKCEKENGEMC